MTHWFTVEQFEQICFDLASEMEWAINEPIPEFRTRYSGKLESCLETPQQTYDGKLLYPTLLDQASALFYFLIKNHPFVNGNKRLALTGLLMFLEKNGFWLFAAPDELYKLTVYTAESDPKQKNAILAEVKLFINALIWPESKFDACINTMVKGRMPRHPKRRGRKHAGFPRVPTSPLRHY